MKLMAYASVLAGLVALSSVSMASAASTMASHASLKCPSCGMPMPTKKTSSMTVPIYVKAKKTLYYCCPMCPSGKSAAAYWKKHHTPMSV